MHLQSPNQVFIIDLVTLEDLHKLSGDARQKVLIILHQLQILNNRDKAMQMVQQE